MAPVPNVVAGFSPRSKPLRVRGTSEAFVDLNHPSKYHQARSNQAYQFLGLSL